MSRPRKTRQDNNTGVSASPNSAPQPQQHPPVLPSAGSRPLFGRPSAPLGLIQPMSPAENGGRRRSYTQNGVHHHHQPNSNIPLPSAWNITDPSLRHLNKLGVTLNGVHDTTVVADRPIPTVLLQEAAGKAVASSQLSPGRLNSHLHPGNARSSSDVYYFEIQILPGLLSSSSNSLEVQIGLVCADESSTEGIVPGDDPNSIGWGSDGLKINGRLYDAMNTPFKPGDVIGCGIEILGMQRVFFTRNGTILVPPSPNTSFLGGNDRPCLPALGFRNGNSSTVRANFGLDTLIPFRWMGSDRLSIVVQQAAPITLTSSISAALPVTSSLTSIYGKLRSESERSKPAKRSSAPYYGTAELDTLDDPILSDPMSVTNPNLTRSVTRPDSASLVAPQFRNPNPPPRARSSPITPPGGPPATSSSASPAYFGTKNTRKSLEDDDPADNNATTSAHFNLPGPNAGSMTGNRSSLYGQQSAGSSAGVPPGNGQWGHTSESLPERKPQLKLASGPHQSPLSAQSSGRTNTQSERIKITEAKSPSFDARAYQSTSPRDDDGDRKQPPRPKSPSHRNLPNPYETTPDSPERPASSANHVAAVAASGDVTAIAKENYRTLLLAAGDKKVEYSYIQELLSICIADQETLKRKLSSALEDGNLVDNLEELFSVNDGICSAIEAGEKLLKTATKKTTKKKPLEGPTIELLVDNEDVFSLICMLRAQNEKRLAAALALMKFARESEPLRDEIRSSGGMHSFLTLFRTNGMARELQVVASLAVAYILPSFVVSSQTSSALGLKIIECLRFLVASRPVTPQGVSISREEMCKAAAIGVNILWINAVLPLLKSELSKIDARKTAPVLTRVRTAGYERSTRGRLGGGVFDQGQDSVEVKELTELAVTLITHIARVAHTEKLNIDMGYNIVEQVCEVDVARPIAVREGLLSILVDWIRSKDIERVRPAASALRYLISIEDKYMAGWIHSQVVNEGAVNEIVKLLNESVGYDVRVAVAQMLAALCVAPHTRAAVVEARCVSYLIALLYEHNSPASEQMVQYAGSALLQLAAGAMSRTSANSLVLADSATPDDQDSVITEIVDGWAHGSFIQIAMEHKGKLRSIAVEALRVLSEDTDPKRQTRLHLCSAGAAEALGKTLKDNVPKIGLLKSSAKVDASINDPDGHFYNSVKEIHEALCALANILEPPKPLSKSRQGKQLLHFPNPKETLIKGCVDTAESGGLKSLIWISSLPYTQSTETNLMIVDRMDLIEEACRLLASLSPLLLSDIAASKGCARWASEVFEALDGILRRLADSEDSLSDATNELNIDALRGLGALARYEPLKIQIVEKSLPNLLMLKNLSGDQTDVSSAASQVLLSLGFTEDEITVQVAGNNPQLLVDWFCLQRALTIQAMARAEIRTVVDNMWRLPYDDVTEKSTMKLIRQLSGPSRKSSDESLDETDSMNELFEHYTNDEDSIEQRASLLQQYRDIYGLENTKRFHAPVRASSNDFVSGIADDASLMSRHVFPLNATSAEKEWVLSHSRMLQIDRSSERQSSVEVLPGRIEKLLESCFPSKLLRNDVIPLHDLRPDAAFNFRALMMPQRRYFSFRREGQLLSRLCEKQAAASDCDDVHWTLGFTNSTFAGEFVESLVQTLYLCPMITGLTFVRNPEWLAMRASDSESEGDEGGGLLANLSGSLPPWVSYLTFDNIMSDRDLRALAAIIETMGKLSAGQDLSDHAELLAAGGDDISGQSQGKFNSFSIRNSPEISIESWGSFFKLLGRSGPSKHRPGHTPLSSLKALDLSGNKLGDEACALILELVHDKDSGCNVEQLDLSGNRIGRGTKVVKALRSYIEYYRYSHRIGVAAAQKSWKSTLHTLILAENDLFLGQAAFEIFGLLQHNALCLQSLDLSNNSLEGDYQLLASSLLKNTSLNHLNLSGNKFDGPLIDMILEQINSPGAESGLSFLRFENNSPPFTISQRSNLSAFLRKSRKVAIERYLKERERALSGEPETNAVSFEGTRLEIIDESDTNVHGQNKSFQSNTSRQTGQEHEIEDEPDSGDNMITVLFSAPLVFADGENTLHPFAKLDFEMERELLWQCLKEASRDIEISFDNAHHSRLLATLTKRCSCLHYSGHGHPNFLPFEDGMGGPNWLSVQDIKELIVRDGVAPFKFVFVSACHSGLAGETFASAGVPHVVCCRQDSELKDTAALAFTRQFYLALAVGHTVKESFEQGCKAVRATPNLRDPEQEMEKFVLLPKNGNHDVPVFRAKPVREWPKQPRNQHVMPSKSKRRGSLVRLRSVMGLGAKSSELSVRNMMQEDPSPTPPQFFLGREVDMYYILTAILKMRKRLVSILGKTGVGRSSLACALCHYINERASTISEIHRIYFIKPRQGGRNVSCRSILRQLLDKLEEAGKSRPSDEDTDTEAMLDIICKSLKNDKALIVFDRTELLEKSDEAQELPMILSTLLYETKQVKVLLTGTRSLGQPSIGGQVEHPFNLGPLNFGNTVKLFANLCPHLHTPSERAILFNKLSGDCEEQSELYPGDRNMNTQTKKTLTMLGDGIPATIEKAAYSMSMEDLQQMQP